VVVITLEVVVVVIVPNDIDDGEAEAVPTEAAVITT
jgi:hypothetical protein